MQSSLFIIGADQKWEEKALLRAARACDLKVRFINAFSVEIRMEAKGAELFLTGRSITRLFKRSHVIFRRTRGAQEKMVTLALLAHHWNVPFLDSVASIATNLDKAVFMPSVRPRRLRHIPTAFVNPEEKFYPRSWHFPFPVLLKPVHGRHGEGIWMAENPEQLEEGVRNPGKALMVQPLLSIDAEYRVLVVGQKALGAVQKIPKKGSRIANYAAGAGFFPEKLPSSVTQECVRLCRDQGIDIGGVDLAKVGRKFYLLEINRCPEFRAFQKATGLPVAETILKLIFKKHA